MKYSYHIFDKSLHICGNGKNSIILRDNENYSLLKSSLLNNDFEMVDNLLQPVGQFELTNLQIKEGMAYVPGVGEVEIPTTILATNRQNKKLGLACFNYWFTKIRSGSKLDNKVIRELEYVAALDSSGNLFATNAELEGREFIRARDIPSDYFLKLRKTGGLKEYVEYELNCSVSNAVNNAAKNAAIRDGELQRSFFTSIDFIKSYGTDDINKIVSLIELEVGSLFLWNETQHIQNVAEVLQVFSFKKMLKLLSDEKQHSDLRHNIGIVGEAWKLLKGEVAMKSRYRDFYDLIDWLTKEAKKTRNRDYQLKQEESFPQYSWFDDALVGPYQVNIAKSNHELVDWSTKLGNCLHSYSKKVKAGECFIFGLFEQGDIKYAVEITDGRIGQFEGKSKSKPDNSLKREVTRLLEEDKTIRL